jgi:hypothetical protein
LLQWQVEKRSPGGLALEIHAASWQVPPSNVASWRQLEITVFWQTQVQTQPFGAERDAIVLKKCCLLHP